VRGRWYGGNGYGERVKMFVKKGVKIMYKLEKNYIFCKFSFE